MPTLDAKSSNLIVFVLGGWLLELLEGLCRLAAEWCEALRVP